MCNVCIPILVAVASLVSKILLLFSCLQKRPNFPFGAKTFDQLELAQKIHASRGGCLMLHTKLVGVASPVLEILQLFKFGQISLSDHGL